MSLEVPLGATFMRSDGTECDVTPVLKRIADAILEGGMYDERTGPDGAPLKAGQQVINAVWDARTMLDVIKLAGLHVATGTADQ